MGRSLLQRLGLRGSEVDLIRGRLPESFRDDGDLLVFACERQQGFAISGERVAWIGVDPGGKRDRHAPSWEASISEISRVLWNRIDILDRQELTIRLFEGGQVTVAPLEKGSWSAIRSRIEGASGWQGWPQATIGERLGGFLPARPTSDRSGIVYVDSDRITQAGQEYLLDGSTSARFGYRPAPSGGSSPLRGYALQDLLVRRTMHGMEPYVRIEGDGWRIEQAIAARDPAYASTLVERINDLGQRMRASGGQ